VAAEVTFVAGCAAGRLLAQALLGEREGVELLAGAAIEAKLDLDEASRATLRGYPHATCPAQHSV